MIPRVFHWAELAPFDPFVVSLSWQSKSLFFLQPKSLFFFFFLQPRNVTFSLHFISPFFRFLYFQLCLHPFFFCQCFFHLPLLYFFTSIFSSSTFLLFPLLLPSSSVSNSLPLSIFCLRSFIGSDSQPVEHAMFNFSVNNLSNLVLH